MMDCRILKYLAIGMVMTVALPSGAQENAENRDAQSVSAGDGVKDLNTMWVNAMNRQDEAEDAAKAAFRLLDDLKKIEEKYGASSDPEVQAEMMKVYESMMDIYQYRLPDARKMLQVADTVQKNHAKSTDPLVRDYLPYFRLREAEALFFLGATDEALAICRDIRKLHFAADSEYASSALYGAMLLEIRLLAWEKHYQEALNLAALGWLDAMGPQGGQSSRYGQVDVPDYMNFWQTSIHSRLGHDKEARFFYDYVVNQVPDEEMKAYEMNRLIGEASSDVDMFLAMNRFEEAIRVIEDTMGMLQPDQTPRGQLGRISLLMGKERILDENVRSSERAAAAVDQVIKEFAASESPMIRNIVAEAERYKARKYDGFSDRQMLDRFGDDREPDLEKVVTDSWRKL